MQDSTVNFRMQRLDTAIEHFRKASQFRDVFESPLCTAFLLLPYISG
jgi:hypothetical protein